MRPSVRARSGLLPLLAGWLILGLWGQDAPALQYLEEYSSFTSFAKLPLASLPKRQAWRRAAPGVVEISIPRASGEPDQPALWYHSGSEGKKPLLLVLHSWSADYLQPYGIPYAVFAEKNDWIFLHPDFRGRFNRPEATGSELAVQDVLEALAYARERAPVDEDRVYLAGFSGGAMMSLLLIGRFPELFTAAVAWVPVYDLNDWYRTVRASPYAYTTQYRLDIERSCGGRPDVDAQASEECRKRSPAAFLDRTRGHGVKVFLSGGIRDRFVPPSHAIRAFNDLADPSDRLPEEAYRFLDTHRALPESLQGEAEENRFFAGAGLSVVFRRDSEGVTLFLFEGGHDIVYNAGLHWLAQQHR